MEKPPIYHEYREEEVEEEEHGDAQKLETKTRSDSVPERRSSRAREGALASWNNKV